MAEGVFVVFSGQDIRLPKSKVTALILSPRSTQHSIGPRVRAPLAIVTSPVSPGKTFVPNEMAAGTLPAGIGFSPLCGSCHHSLPCPEAFPTARLPGIFSPPAA